MIIRRLILDFIRQFRFISQNRLEGWSLQFRYIQHTQRQNSGWTNNNLFFGQIKMYVCKKPNQSQPAHNWWTTLICAFVCSNYTHYRMMQAASSTKRKTEQVHSGEKRGDDQDRWARRCAAISTSSRSPVAFVADKLDFPMVLQTAGASSATAWHNLLAFKGKMLKRQGRKEKFDFTPAPVMCMKNKRWEEQVC